MAQAGEKLKNGWHRFRGWQHFWLCILVLITLALHFSVITRPVELILDEQHYVNDARGIIQGEGTERPEHPPLGKIFIVSGIKLFGDNSFGWRFFSVIFGTISVGLFYFICRRLNMPQKATLLATFLFSLDNLGFVMSGVAMLDVFFLTFMLGAFLLYLNGGYLLSGMSMGLSALAKMTGGFALIAIILHWLITGRKRPRHFWASVLLAPVSFLVFLPILGIITNGGVINPLERTKYMLAAMSGLTFETAAHSATSRPWEWILEPNIMSFWYDPHYMAAISFTIGALIIPAVLYMIYRSRKSGNAALFGLMWFASTYLIWIPISLVTDRVSFVYYFYPTVGAICIGLGLGLHHLIELSKEKTPKKRRAIIGGVIIYLLLHVAIFVIISPVFSPFTQQFQNLAVT